MTDDLIAILVDEDLVELLHTDDCDHEGTVWVGAWHCDGDPVGSVRDQYTCTCGVGEYYADLYHFVVYDPDGAYPAGRDGFVVIEFFGAIR